MKRALVLLALLACQPAATQTSSAQVSAPAGLDETTASGAPKGDACNRDIPDCAAACALRETGRLEHIDWFDRRCAAVVLGKNPDKAVGYLQPAPADYDTMPPAAATTGAASPPSTAPPLPSTRQLPPNYDPFSNRGPSEPAECTVARSMRAKGQTREADVLAALCAAKGGSETKEANRDLDLGF